MKLNRIEISTAILAVLYPATLLSSGDLSWMPDAVLAFVIATLMAFAIFLLRQRSRANKTLTYGRLEVSVSTALFGNLFLNELINKPHSLLTVLGGLAFSTTLAALVVTIWREKNTTNSNSQTA